MRVAAVQFKAQKGQLDASLDALRALATRAARGADLVVLPEMAATGYVFDSLDAVRQVAEVPDGPTLAALAPVCAEQGCWMVAGFPERAGDRVYNSALVIDPDGALAFTYRKTLLYYDDLPWASVGDSGYRSFDTGNGKFGVGICMDLNDHRFVAWCAEAGLRAVATPMCWIEEGYDVWRYWKRRMEGVPAALIAANTYGSEGTTRFSGVSAVIDGERVLSAAPRSGDWIAAANLSD